MMVLPPEAPAPRADRPAIKLLHNDANVRVIAFHLLPGQRIPAHRSDSTVILQVLEGAGTFRGASGESLLGPGNTAVFAPGEEHAIEAESAPLRFLAILAPSPR